MYTAQAEYVFSFILFDSVCLIDTCIVLAIFCCQFTLTSNFWQDFALYDNVSPYWTKNPLGSATQFLQGRDSIVGLQIDV